MVGPFIADEPCVGSVLEPHGLPGTVLEPKRLCTCIYTCFTHICMHACIHIHTCRHIYNTERRDYVTSCIIKVMAADR